MAYETAVLMQLGARTAKHPIRMGGFSPHIRLTDYDVAIEHDLRLHWAI